MCSSVGAPGRCRPRTVASFRRLLAGTILLAAGWLVFPVVGAPPSAAAAADPIAISSPSDGAIVTPVAGSGGASGIRIAGTQHPTETSSIAVSIDGRFVPCGPGSDVGVSDPDCLLAPLTESDGTWTYFLREEQFEAIGLDFGGQHTIHAVLLDHPDADGHDVEIGRAGITIAIATPGWRDSSVSRLATGEPDAPSVLAATVTVQGAGLTAERALVTAVVTIILLLIVGYPSHLIGSVLGDEKNYGRLFGRPTAWWRRMTGRARRRVPTGWLPLAVGMTAATIIAGFVDPGFGFNAGSLRLVASVAIAFAIQNLLGWWLIRRALRITDPELKPGIRFRFGSLPILLVAVLASRLVGFEPGMVFGLLVGLSFGAKLATARQARVTLVGSGYAFGLAIVGWLGYSMVIGAAGNGAGWWATFASETMSGLAVSGIAALPIALLPMAFADGGAIFAWKKRVWAVCYGIGLFSFFVILLPLPSSWGEVATPLATWIGLYVGYAVLAVAVWAWFRFSAAPAPGAAEAASPQ